MSSRPVTSPTKVENGTSGNSATPQSTDAVAQTRHGRVQTRSKAGGNCRTSEDEWLHGLIRSRRGPTVQNFGAFYNNAARGSGLCWWRRTGEAWDVDAKAPSARPGFSSMEAFFIVRVCDGAGEAEDQTAVAIALRRQAGSGIVGSAASCLPSGGEHNRKAKGKSSANSNRRANATENRNVGEGKDPEADNGAEIGEGYRGKGSLVIICARLMTFKEESVIRADGDGQ